MAYSRFSNSDIYLFQGYDNRYYLSVASYRVYYIFRRLLRWLMYLILKKQNKYLIKLYVFLTRINFPIYKRKIKSKYRGADFVFDNADQLIIKLIDLYQDGIKFDLEIIKEIIYDKQSE